MNAAARLIEELSRAGIVLEHQDQRLIIDGPHASLNDGLIEKVRSLKPQLIAHLSSQSTHWGHDDWQALFDERAAICEFDGGFDRKQAELMAFEECVERWLVSNPPLEMPPGQCLRCGKTATAEASRVVALTGADGQSGVLHAQCAPQWQKLRRWEARRALLWLLSDPANRATEENTPAAVRQ